MKNMIMVLAMAFLCQGCVSGVVAYRTNNEHIQKMVQVKPMGGKLWLGVDLWNITKAWFQSFAEHPVLMPAAVGLDTLIGYGVYELGRRDGSKDTAGTAEPVSDPTRPYTIHADNVIIGNYNTMTVESTNDQ